MATPAIKKTLRAIQTREETISELSSLNSKYGTSDFINQLQGELNTLHNTLSTQLEDNSKTLNYVVSKDDHVNDNWFMQWHRQLSNKTLKLANKDV